LVILKCIQTALRVLLTTPLSVASENVVSASWR